MDEPTCCHCQFYFMTWDKQQPHGCHAFGFKSKALPSRVVEETSAEDCGYFQERPTPPPVRSDLPLW